MFRVDAQNSIKLPVILLTIAALVFGFFCVGMFQKAPMVMHGTGMTDMVSIGGEQTCCGGSMSQHMQSWTNTFLTTPDTLRNGLALFALAFLAALVFIKSLFSYTATDQKLLVNKSYFRQRRSLLVFSPLKLAFARGILNPKLY